jgi:hypothetical protein
MNFGFSILPYGRLLNFYCVSKPPYLNEFCSYIREKEMEEEILMQRREEEGRGKERRKALLEKEERKWKEIEASLISSIPNAGGREAAAMAAAVRAVGGDAVLDDSFARERVASIARRIRTTQLARRAVQVEFQL